jgi:hypothetical protein
MPPKSAKPTNDELLAQFDDLGIDTATKKEEAPNNDAPPKPAEKDPLAELETLASQRPATPRLSTEARRSKPSSGRTSEDRPALSSRKSEDVIPHQATVQEEKQPQQPSENKEATVQDSAESAGGGWWGGILSTASAAMKHAEAAVKEIQKNEEAQKWAEQVKGNVGALRDFGTYIIITIVVTFFFKKKVTDECSRRRTENACHADLHFAYPYPCAPDFFS